MLIIQKYVKKVDINAREELQASRLLTLRVEKIILDFTPKLRGDI